MFYSKSLNYVDKYKGPGQNRNACVGRIFNDCERKGSSSSENLKFHGTLLNQMSDPP